MFKKSTLLLILCIAFFSANVFSQSKNELAIRQLLQTQENAWNNGQLDNFMKGYWKNDSLMFIGKSGITYGWQKTLDNYKKGYPDAATMGKLSFTLLQLRSLSAEYYFVVGKWHLQRSMGDIGGHFTLLFRKINGAWVIVADHSS
jgi:ketosteroid isomerase-like protein